MHFLILKDKLMDKDYYGPRNFVACSLPASLGYVIEGYHRTIITELYKEGKKLGSQVLKGRYQVYPMNP
jgi:hypothetical protein